MREDTFEILKSAVNIARNRQVEKLSDLKEKLLKLYPNKQAGIEEAIKFWAARVSQPT